MGVLKSALTVGVLGAVCAFIILALIFARVSAIVVALVVVPVGVGGLIALSVWRRGTWREGTQRRAVLLLQAAATQLIARSITGIGVGALQASGSVTASEAPSSLSLAIEYALGSRGGVAWDLVSAVLGFGFLMASVWIARTPTPTTPPAAPDSSPMLALDPAPLSQSQVNRARKYKTYDSDLPPRTEYWVGREEETRLARELQRGVLTITGIGGQGKSYLAAKLLEEWRAAHPQGFWDWRDCREEGDRLETQLVSVIERVTAGDIAPRTLDGATPERLARLLFRITRATSGFIVFDNVDHYTNVEQHICRGS